jgi:hypothetical protein
VTLTAKAQAPVKTDSGRPRYRLTIGGEAFSGRLFDCRASYGADGSSELTISADGGLERYQNARVRLYLGYGDDLVEWFAGDLADPQDEHWGGPATATAYGPSGRLSRVPYLGQHSYAGDNLGSFVLDLARRAGMPGGSVEVLGAASFVLDASATMTVSTYLLEAEESVLPSAGYVGSDRPGYRRRYMPRPLPGQTGGYAARYDEGSYPPGGFVAKSLGRNLYEWVCVFRAGEGGSVEEAKGGVYELVRVEPEGRFRPPKDSTFFVPDFAGSAGEARQEAARWARRLKRGSYACSLEGISANPGLLPFDSIAAETTEFRDEGGKTKERYRTSYGFAIDGGIEVNVSREGLPMAMRGEGIKLSEKKLPKPFFVRRPSPYVVRRPGGVTWDDERTFEELGGYTFEEIS